MTPTAAAEPQDVRLLQSAFRSFDRAAATLEESYRALRAKVERMDLELAAANDALRAHLREKEEMRMHLEAVLESLTTGVIVADDRGAVVRCNGAAEAMLGLARTQLVGRGLDAVLAGAGLDGTDYPVAAPNGAVLSVSRTRLRNQSGQVAGSLALLHDISALRRLEERLQRRSRLAAMGEMVGRIAHEIRNPLGSVELFASMLRRDLAHEPERRRYADHISMAVSAMDGLLANLLGYIRPDRPRTGWHATEPLVQEALALATHGLARAPVRVVLAFEPGAGRLWCDAAQIRQVLLNLVLNAVQAMPQGGTLTVAAAPVLERDEPGGAGCESGRAGSGPGDGACRPRWLRLSVSDTGSGVPADVLPRVFDPFFTTRRAGTGLGLAIVHAVVEGHGGRVEVESVAGRGSTFTVLLPAPPPGPARAAPAARGIARVRPDEPDEREETPCTRKP